MSGLSATGGGDNLADHATTGGAGVKVEPLPTLLSARRRLANELLVAAARHSAIVDELHDLELMREQGPLSDEEEQRERELRELRADARQRHDRAARDLRKLMAGARLW